VVGTAEDPARIEQLEAELRQLREREAVARREIAARRDENHVLREQQTALGEVLGVIASSPTDLQQVLDALVVSAAQLCGADIAHVGRLDGDEVVCLASTDPMNRGHRFSRAGTIAEVTLLEGRTIHVHGSPDEQRARFPNSPGIQIGG